MNEDAFYPLSSTFTGISILGFFVSIWLVPSWSTAWAFAFALFFVIMFIASFITMSKAQPIPKHMDALAIHEPFRRQRVEDKKTFKKEPARLQPKWFDALFVIFIIMAGYYIFQSLMYSSAVVDPVWFIVIMTIYVIVMIWLIVDVVSSEELSSFWQLMNIIMILLFGPIGMFIYYFYRRTTAK